MATRRKTAKKTKAKSKPAKATKPAKKKTVKKAPKKTTRAKVATAAKRPAAAKKKTAKKIAKAAKPAKAAPKVKNAKPSAKAGKGRAKGANATYLGRADSLNASISLLLVDGAAAADAWKGVDPDDLDAIEKATNKIAKLGNGLDNGKARSFKLGDSTGLGFQLSVGKGIAHVFRTSDRLVVAEGFVDDIESPEFLSYVAAPASKGATDGGTLDSTSGVIALMIPGGAYEDLPSRLRSATDESKGARIGSETPGLLLKVAARKYRLLLEPETTSGFGQAARAVLEPA